VIAKQQSDVQFVLVVAPSRSLAEAQQIVAIAGWFSAGRKHCASFIAKRARRRRATALPCERHGDFGSPITGHANGDVYKESSTLAYAGS